MGATVSMDQFNIMERDLQEQIDYLRAKNKVLKTRHRQDIESVNHALFWIMEAHVKSRDFKWLVEYLDESLYIPLTTKKERKRQAKRAAAEAASRDMLMAQFRAEVPCE